MAKAAQCRNQDKGLFGLHLYLSLIETTSQGLKITQNVSFNIASEASYVYIKVSHFEFWHFSLIFVVLKVTCLVTLFSRKLQVFKKSPKLTIFGIFNELLSTQNVNVARFARNVE